MRKLRAKPSPTPSLPTRGGLLEYCAQKGPPELAAHAREALAGGFDERVRAYWETGDSTPWRGPTRGRCGRPVSRCTAD